MLLPTPGTTPCCDGAAGKGGTASSTGRRQLGARSLPRSLLPASVINFRTGHPRHQAFASSPTQATHGGPHRPAARLAAATVSYGSQVTIPEPVPEATSLPDDPPVRSELIDLTRAVKRCRTWQQLRALYWTNRTRQGAINVVAFFTRLATLLPGLPALLQQSSLPDLDPGDSTEPLSGMQAGQSFPAVSSARQVGLGQRQRGSSRRTEGLGRTTAAAASNGAAGAHRMGWGRDRDRGPDSGGAARPATAETLSAAERAALRQLVVRMTYDACSFTREQVAAGRLGKVLQEGVAPWDTKAFLWYLMATDGGERGGGPPGERTRKAHAPERQPPQNQRPQPRPTSFWDWLRDHPAAWIDPVASRVTFGLQHWDDVPPAAVQGPHGAEIAEAAGAPRGGSPVAGAYGTYSTATGLPSASGDLTFSGAAAQRVRKLPLCFGPLELSTLAWAAARLQLHLAVPEHAAWLLHDLLYSSYQQMSYFDGRQLAQLSYSLAQLGPCVPPARWRRRFLSAARWRMAQMDSQSLANLAHSLEPLRLQPDPAWLRDLLAASQRVMERREVTAAELTQLSWAVFSSRRRLYRPRRWAAEVLAVAGAVLSDYQTPAITTISHIPLPPLSEAAATPLSPLPSLPTAPSPRPSSPAPTPASASLSPSATSTPSRFSPPSPPSPPPLQALSLKKPSGRAFNRSQSAACVRALDELPPLLRALGAPLTLTQLEELRARLSLPQQPRDGEGREAGMDGEHPTAGGQKQPVDPALTPSSPPQPPLPSQNQQSDHVTHGHSKGSSLSLAALPVGSSAGGSTSAHPQQGTATPADPGVLPREAHDLLAAVAAGRPPCSALGVWLLRQPPTVLLAMRAWAAAGGTVVGGAAAAGGRGAPGQLRHSGCGTKERKARMEEEQGAGEKEGQGPGQDQEEGQEVEDEEGDEGLPGTGLPPARASLQLAAHFARTRSSSATLQPPASPHLTSRWRATSPPTNLRAPSPLGTAHTLEQATAFAPDPEPLPLDSLLLTLHTACWPREPWLEALASAASAQLHSPGFHAQSLGIILWSLAGLGYRPRPGWLEPWLDRVSELWLDFRPPNLVSVLCALSTWGELPVGAQAATLRAAAVRVVPAMGPRELQLAASALAQLGELPPPPPSQPPVAAGAAAGSPAAPPAHGVDGAADEKRSGVTKGGDVRSGVTKGGDVRSGVTKGGDVRSLPGVSAGVLSRGAPGGGAGLSGRTARGPELRGGQRRGGEVGLFVPFVGPPAPAPPGTIDALVASPGGPPRRVERGGFRASSGAGGGGADAGTEGLAGVGQCSQGRGVRHRDLEPVVARLLVGRAVQVSYSYSPRHMARLLRLLVQRLGCLVDLPTLRELLEGNAAHLESIVARARPRSQAGPGGRVGVKLGSWRPPGTVASGFGGARGGMSGHVGIGSEAGQGDRSRQRQRRRRLVRRRDMEELAAAALDAARDVAGSNESLSDEAAAALLPARWWKAYLAVLDAR